MNTQANTQANTNDIKTYQERVDEIENAGGMINGDDVRRLLREEAEELRLALHSERLARQNAKVAVPSWSQLNELSKVYGHLYASPHHVTFTVSGLQSLITEVMKAPKEKTDVVNNG